MALSYEQYAKEKGIKEPVKKKPEGLLGAVSNFLPTAGGVGGALAGGAAGAALGSVVPVIGTGIGGLIGAVLGGAGGSAAGKFGENVVEGEQDLGKDVLNEALIGGLTSTPITAGGKLLKGAVKAPFVEGALKQGAKEAGGLAIPKAATGLREKAAAEIAATAPEASGGILNRVGKRLTEGGSGLKPEPTAGGIANLERQSEFMSRYVGTPRQQRIAMEKDMGNLSNQVDDILAKNPTPIKGTDVRTQVQQAIDDPLKYADVDLALPGVQKSLSSHLTKFESTTSAKELNDYIKKLNPIAKRAQDKIARGATITDKESAALVAKRAGDEVLSAIPEIKPLKQDMAMIFEVTPQVAKAAEKGIGLPMTAGVSTKAPVQAAKGAQSVLGSLMQGKKGGLLSRAGADAAEKATATGGQGVLGTVARESLLGTRGTETAQAEEPQAQIDGLLEQPGLEASAAPEVDQYTQIQQGLQNAALQALANGDSKGLDNILAVAQFLQSTAPSQASKKPLSAEAAKVVGNAQSGLDSLAQLRGAIESGGGVPTGTLVPGRELFGNLGANVLGTAGYDTAAKNVADVITRLRTGAALTDAEEQFYKSQLPQAFDSPEVREQKLSMFNDLFTRLLTNTGTAGTDLQAQIGA